ncbi:flagellar biosynthetic protein FliO [Photobacterium ganghwense]|uniref:flagellar biosynthetic protein FliO n=1 Tax=Photobacterium ganghwense TaxID=320778 RepID=UPI004056AD39
MSVHQKRLAQVGLGLCYGVALCYGLLGAGPAMAAGTAPELNIATTLASLILVLVIIVLLAWLLKRMKLPGMQGGDRTLRVLRQLPVGQRERIVLLQVGDEQMLVGVTQQNISMLGKLDTPIATDEMQGSGEFASHLSRLLKKDEKK